MPTVSLTYLDPETGEMIEKLSFHLEENELLFDGIERNGHQLPHGCLAGSCGSCALSIHAGLDSLTPAKAVEQDTINHVTSTKKFPNGEGVRLSCRAKVTNKDISLHIISRTNK